MYPKVDTDICIKCGKCKTVCPIINNKKEKKELDGYVLNNKNIEIRKNSTSGGVFTEIARNVLNKDGVVYGACFNNSFEVVHKSVENIEEIEKFRGSKYVQSFLGNTFEEIRKNLENDRYVCFSGTPCQVAGLLSFLKKDYEKLITVDIMCHAVPSPLVFEKYLEYIKKNKLDGEIIKKISFRDKEKYGYKYSMMTIKSESFKYSEGIDTDPYLRAFFCDFSDRPSCYKCYFKHLYHISDFTIWDCFNISIFDKKLDDDLGSSRMIINTNKGKMIWNEISSEFYYSKVNVDILTKNVKEMINSVNLPLRRDEFFEDINNMGEESFDKYFPINIRVKFEKGVRVFLAKTGLYNKIKNLYKKILKK